MRQPRSKAVYPAKTNCSAYSGGRVKGRKGEEMSSRLCEQARVMGLYKHIRTYIPAYPQIAQSHQHLHP